MNPINEINELVGRLIEAGHTDESILIGLVAAALEENKELELHQKLEELLPEYTSTSIKDILTRNAINHN